MYWEIRNIIRKKCYYYVHSSTQPYNSLSQKKTLTPISIPQTLALKNNLPSKIFLVEPVPNRAPERANNNRVNERSLSFLFSRIESWDEKRRESDGCKIFGRVIATLLFQFCRSTRNLARSTTSFSRSVQAIAYYTRQGVFIVGGATRLLEKRGEEESSFSR